jgi:hypothetical protein
VVNKRYAEQQCCRDSRRRSEFPVKGCCFVFDPTPQLEAPAARCSPAKPVIFFFTQGHGCAVLRRPSGAQLGASRGRPTSARLRAPRLRQESARRARSRTIRNNKQAPLIPGLLRRRRMQCRRRRTSQAKKKTISPFSSPKARAAVRADARK